MVVFLSLNNKELQAKQQLPRALRNDLLKMLAYSKVWFTKQNPINSCLYSGERVSSKFHHRKGKCNVPGANSHVVT